MLFEFTDESSTFTVKDVAYFPATGALNYDKRDDLLLPVIFKRSINQRAGGFITRPRDCKMRDLHVLRVIEGIAVDHAHFTLRRNCIFPNQVGEALLEILIKQRAAARLKKRTVLLVVNAVQVSDQCIG